MSMHGYQQHAWIFQQQALKGTLYFGILWNSMRLQVHSDFHEVFLSPHVRRALALHLTIPSNKEHPAVMVSH